MIFYLEVQRPTSVTKKNGSAIHIRLFIAQKAIIAPAATEAANATRPPLDIPRGRVEDPAELGVEEPVPEADALPEPELLWEPEAEAFVVRGVEVARVVLQIVFRLQYLIIETETLTWRLSLLHQSQSQFQSKKKLPKLMNRWW